MKNDTMHGAEGAPTRGLVTMSIGRELSRFGLRSQKDPDTGRSFFLWDSMFPVNDEGQPLPAYTVQETAKMFFGMGPDWLRWRYRPDKPDANGHHRFPHGYFVLGDVILEAKRTEKGNRYYTLADIERMAVALVENEAIAPERLYTILQLVLLEAQLHGIIPTTLPDE